MITAYILNFYRPFVKSQGPFGERGKNRWKKAAKEGILRKKSERSVPMREIEIFYLTGCPYCKNARKAVEELLREEPAYGALPLRWIEENEEKDLADSRDYYRVPSVFYQGDKLYEASPFQDYEAIKAHLKAAFDQVLAP